MLRSVVADIFGGSPIRPLQKQMRSVHECTKLLPEFIDAVLVEDGLQLADAHHMAHVARSLRACARRAASRGSRWLEPRSRADRRHEDGICKSWPLVLLAGP